MEFHGFVGPFMAQGRYNMLEGAEFGRKPKNPIAEPITACWRIAEVP